MKAELLARRPTVHVELEVRFGRIDGGGFVPGLTPDDHASCIEYMEAYEGWSEDVAWNRTTDYFFNNRGRSVRQTVAVDPDDYSYCNHPVISKQTCVTFVFEVDEHHRAIKLSLASEAAVDDPPKIARPTWVRKKYRRSFRAGDTRFDFTIVQSGRNKTEFGPHTYEAEIEHDGADGAAKLVHNVWQMYAAQGVDLDSRGPCVLVSRDYRTTAPITAPTTAATEPNSSG